MGYQVRNLSELKKLPGNPRIIRDSQFKILCQSIRDNKDYFEARPIILSDRTGELIIIAGNQRYEAAKSIGMKQVPTFLIEGLTEEREKELVIRDNVQNGEWDFDALANGQWGDIAQLSEWGVDIDIDLTPEDEEAEEDNYDVEDGLAAVGEPKSKLGDIYQLGNHRLICGDSTKKEHIAALMGGEAVDLLITDPPYNVNYEASNGKKIQNDNMSDSNFKQFLIDAFEASNMAMKPGAAFYIWHADSEGYNFRAASQEAGWKVRQCLIWNKNSLVLGRQDYQWKHEPCLYGWKDGAAHYFIDDRSQTTVIEDKVDLDKLSKAELKSMIKDMLQGDVPTTIIEENKPARNAEHPTMKPIKLLARIMKNSSKKGQNVLDTFGGSGSTLITSEQLGRHCFMSEFDPKYVDVIINRWEQLTGGAAELIGNFLEVGKSTC
ncbi:DNA modification methylase [uncultured Bacteroides sp.]|uniref:DNA modification methylase n=1 Tax=uncultured Bacteroides sp. TaxID=162156 RepID=UPI002AAAA5F9|nr:DNA modification methylase [uncultured Bacteroides sp.]